VDATIDFFDALGVATKVEETGKVFPVSNKAADVLAALLRRLQRSGAVLALEEPLRSLDKTDAGFLLTTPRRTLTASRVILTTGGQSYPGSGTTGDGYTFAAQFGHTIIPPRPALVPITVAASWVSDLRGVTLPDVSVRIIGEGKTLLARRGSMLFAHFGLSGPVILDLSRVVSGHPQPGSLHLEIDFLPSVSETDLGNFLKTESVSSGKKQLAVVLATHLPRRLCDTLLTLAGLALDRRAAGLSKEDRARLVQCVKRAALPVNGTLGFGKAEVTAGGVSLEEVDSRTMQSKLACGLFLAGEVLDLDGPIGGYNFQAAWSTGWLAGSSV
jgi:predicted Rossmann fold flavoprotein